MSKVENTGTESDTQTIILDVAGNQQDSRSETVGSGNTASGSLSWNTSTGDAGDYTATVSSSETSDSVSVSVESATVTRSDAIATADAWYEPQSDGFFQQIKDNPGDGWPSSFDPGGSYDSTLFNGQGGIELSNSTNLAISGPPTNQEGAVIGGPAIARSGSTVSLGLSGSFNPWPYTLGASGNSAWYNVPSDGLDSSWEVTDISEGSVEIIEHGSNASISYSYISGIESVESNSDAPGRIFVGDQGGTGALSDVAAVTGRTKLPDEIRNYFDTEYR